MENNLILFSHTDYPEFSFEVDCDGIKDDGHYMGITPIIKGNRMETEFFYYTAPFLYPILDHVSHKIEKISIKNTSIQGTENDGDFLKVMFEGSNYGILSPVGGNDKLFMETAFYFEEGILCITLNGLYYILPSMSDTEVRIVSNEKDILKSIKLNSEAFQEYFDNVTEIEINDGIFGNIEIQTEIERLQLQVHQDKGQKQILSKIFIGF